MEKYSVSDFDIFDDHRSFIENRRVIKKVYNSFLYPFFNAYKVKRCKDILYSKSFSVKRKDAIWCYLNNDISFNDAKKILNNSFYNDSEFIVINEVIKDKEVSKKF